MAMDAEREVSQPLTAPHGVTAGIAGPACDAWGNRYAVNDAREGTLGKVPPAGGGSTLLALPAGSSGPGIRFGRDGTGCASAARRSNDL